MQSRRLDERSGEAHCPPTTEQSRGTSEHALLDFTGGYQSNVRCQWNIQCNQ
eukprot:COSAG03_NODE_5230_length_1305_cov_2.506633_1_plen_51_part_10